jgi:hypothetical protein
METQVFCDVIYVIVWVVPGVSKDRSAFLIKGLLDLKGEVTVVFQNIRHASFNNLMSLPRRI